MNYLSAKGFQRAERLVELFTKTPELLLNGTPCAIYAMQPKDETGSIRAIQTVEPLAAALKRPIISTFKRKKD